MTKQEFLMLEKIFSADMCNTQFHSKSKLAKKLIEDGYVIEIIEEKYYPPIGKAIFKSLTLTDLGHMNFCYECDKYYDFDGKLIK